MFTSCGNFRGLNCPFYALGNGVCRRPYCHFRHVRSTSRAETERPQSNRPPGSIDDVYPQTADVSRFVVAPPTPVAPSSSPAISPAAHQDGAPPKDAAVQYVPTPIAQIALARRRQKMASSRTSQRAKTATPTYVPTPLSRIKVQPESNSPSRKYQLTDSSTNEGDDSEYDPTKLSYALSGDGKSTKYSLEHSLPVGDDEYDPLRDNSLLAVDRPKPVSSGTSVHRGHLDGASSKLSDFLETEGSRNKKPTQSSKHGELASQAGIVDKDDGLYDFNDAEIIDENNDEIDEYDPFHTDGDSNTSAKYTPTAKYSISGLHAEQGDETEYDPCSNFSSRETSESQQTVERGLELRNQEESSDSDMLVIDETVDSKRKASSSEEEPACRKKQKCSAGDNSSALENEGSVGDDTAGDAWVGDLAQDYFLAGGCVNFDPPPVPTCSFNPSYSYNPRDTDQGQDGLNSDAQELNPAAYLTKLSQSTADDSRVKEKPKPKTSQAVSGQKTTQERKTDPKKIKQGSTKTKENSSTKRSADASKRKDLTNKKQGTVSKIEERHEIENRQADGPSGTTTSDDKSSNEVKQSEQRRPSVSSDQLSSFFKRMNEHKSQKAKVSAAKERRKYTSKHSAKNDLAAETKKSLVSEKTSQESVNTKERKHQSSSGRQQSTCSNAKSCDLPEKGKIIVIDGSGSSEDNLAKPSRISMTNGSPKEETSLASENNLAAKISKREASTKLLFGDDSDSDNSDVQILARQSEDDIFLISDGSSGTDRMTKTHKAKRHSTAKESSSTPKVRQNQRKGAGKNLSGNTGHTHADERETSPIIASWTQHGQKSSWKDHVRRDSSHQKTQSMESKSASSQKRDRPQSLPRDKFHHDSRHSSIPGKLSSDKVRVGDLTTSNRTKPTDKKQIPPRFQVEKSDAESSSPLDLGLESVSTSDDEVAELSDGYDLHDVELSFSESDTFEECLRIFQEEPVGKCTKEPRHPHPEPTQQRSEDLVLSTGKQRVAHASKFNSSQAKYRRCAPKPKARLTPLQVCHNRYVQAQQSVREQQERAHQRRQQETLQAPTGHTPAPSAGKRVAHVPSPRPGPATKPPAQPVMGVNAKIQQKYSIGHSARTEQTLAITAPKGERRLAHVPKQVNPRPVIPPDSAGKVPSNVRQRYLNLFIDEFLKTTQSEQDSFDQGLKEEKLVYERATSKNIYLNLSINTLKRLRASRAPGQAKPTSPPAPGKASISHEAVIGGKPATQHSYTLNRSLHNRLASQEESKYEGTFLYKKLKAYVLTEEQLFENRYPRPSDTPGHATVKESDKKKRIPADPNQHICSRCGKTFLRRPDGRYITRESCTYHWGKFWQNKVGGSLEGRFNCCSGTLDAKGCSIAKYHVTEDKTGNLTGFMKTVVKSPPPDGNPGLYAIDCEMCYTVKALELTRVTVVDDKLQCVYDTLVKPNAEVVDYNTRFSGITEEDLKSAKTTLQDVQAVLLSMCSSDTILIGHSLESDMLALKMIHGTVVDTAVIFPHRRGLPFKRALRTLMAECLNRIIQNDIGGHDSKEDAKSCMELMIWKAKQDAKTKKSSL